MAASEAKKDEIIDRLLEGLSRSGKLKFAIKRSGTVADLAKAKAAYTALDDKIDSLLAKAMLAWNINSAATVKDIKKASSMLERSITKIKKKIDTAQHAIKALGYVDDLIKVATRIISNT